MANDYIQDKVFFSKYKAERRIGEGSFGKIYLAKDIQTNECFALKFENKGKDQNLLEQEAHILNYLKGGEGIPAVKAFGYSGSYNILIMELLGKSLEDLFQISNKSFSIKTVCMIGEQMLNRIEYVHHRHLIHRDIKPDNFAVGLEDSAKIIYIIDFGLAKKYRSSKTLEHTKYVNNKKLTGTARYASVNALKGYEHSRRDDLESIAYILIYFLKGSLPWQGLKQNKKDDRYKSILDKKRRITSEELCFGLPVEFRDLAAYTRNLRFEEDPNYNFLRLLLRQVMNRSKYKIDNVFDWSIITRTERLKQLTQLPTEEEIIYNDDIEDKSNDNSEETANKNMIEEEGTTFNNLDENMVSKPMEVNQYKFFNAIEITNRPHHSPKPKDKLRVNSIEFHKGNRLFLSDRNMRNVPNNNYLRNSTFNYINNRNTTQITHPLSSTNNDCIVF